MKVVYITGPYRAETINGIHDNIEAARKVAIEYWRSGVAVICPHLNSAMMFGACEEEIFLEGYFELLKRSDCVVMLNGWAKSKGSIEEHSAAVDLDKHIIYLGEK